MYKLPTASIIICTYTRDRWTDLVAVVESVRRQETVAQEVIIVVDHNTALLRQVRQQWPDVRVVANAQKPGLSGARNSGIAVAAGEIVVFLDDDAVADPRWLQTLLRPFVDPWVLGVGGCVYPAWVKECPYWLPEEFYWVVGCTYRGIPPSVGIIRNPIGANMAFRRTVFERINGFRSEIGRVGTKPVGCEETELCIRAYQHWPEHVFLYIPEAIVYHRVPPTRTTLHYFFARCYAEGLSKAFVSQYVGAKHGLSSERMYIFHTLPAGAMRHLAVALLQGKLAGCVRAAMLLAGLVTTVAGYLAASISLRRTKLKKICETSETSETSDTDIKPAIR